MSKSRISELDAEMRAISKLMDREKGLFEIGRISYEEFIERIGELARMMIALSQERNNLGG